MTPQKIRLHHDGMLARIEWTETVEVRNGSVTQIAAASAVRDMFTAQKMLTVYKEAWHGPVVFDTLRTRAKKAKAGKPAVHGTLTYRLRWRGTYTAADALHRQDVRFHRVDPATI